MLKLTIDGTTKEIPVGNFENFENLYTRMVSELNQENRVICNLLLNDSKMEDGNQFDYFQMKIEDVFHLELITQDKSSMLKETIMLTKEHLETLKNNINTSINSFQKANNIKAQKYLAAVIEGFRWFNHSLKLMISLLKINQKNQKLQHNIDLLIQKTSKTFDSLHKNQEYDDTIIISDLLQYELLNNIQEWELILENIAQYNETHMKIK